MPLGPSKSLGLSMALLVVPVAVFAQDTVTHMTPGLWTYAVSMAGIDAGTMELCLDGDLKTTLAAINGPQPRRQPSKATCAKPVVTPLQDGRRIDTTCTGPEHTSHMVMTMQEISPTHVKTEADSTLDGKPALKIVMDAQRTGECPASMKPGDRKIHLNVMKLPALMAAQKVNQKRNATDGQ